MRLLHGRDHEERYRKITEMIPEGAEVLELCAGDCRLYEKYLRVKKCKYLASDINKNFIRYARRKKINVKKINLFKDKIPKSDFIVIQASLYQFIPNHKIICDKILNSTKKKLIISESIIRNLATSNNPVISFIAKRINNPGDGYKTERFNEKMLERFTEAELHKMGEPELILLIRKLAIRYEKELKGDAKLIYI